MKILGTSSVSLQAAQAWATARGAHQRFIDVAPHYWDAAPAYGIPPEILYAQAAHETNKGKYTGVVPWTHHNWAGIKTEDGWSNTDPAHHQAFPDDAEGVLAHVQHLWRYASRNHTEDRLPDGDRLVDPRFHLVTKFTDSVEGLGGAWAPALSYGTGLLPIIVDIRKFANDGSWGMAGDDSRFEWLPELAGEIGYPSGSHGRGGQPIDLFVLHITIGNDSLAYLREAHGNSAHYLTWKNGKPRAQMVAEADAAWAAGNRLYNQRGIQFEHEKRNLSDPWTDEMYANLADAALPIAKRNNLPLVYLGKDNGPGRRGFIGHSDVPDPVDAGLWGGDGNHTDPGSTFDWPRFIRLMEALDTGTPVDPDYRLFPETGHGIGHGFRTFWETRGGLAIFGYPLTEEIQEGGLTVQYFERARFEYHPENAAPYDVLLTRLGAEALERRAA